MKSGDQSVIFQAMRKITVILLVLGVIAGVPAWAQMQEPDFAEPLQTEAPPVVVELFTSKNCPACPPADKYIKTVAAMDGVIALSCPVDYFDGPNENFGQAFCTSRQTDYIKQIGRRSHYTPQMMVNGHMDVIGYETGKVRAKIVQGRSERIKKAEIVPKSVGVYNYNLPTMALTNSANIWIAVYSQKKSVQERGMEKDYYNIVTYYQQLGTWNGGAKSGAFYPPVKETSKGIAVIAQDSVTGKILAAGEYKL